MLGSLLSILLFLPLVTGLLLLLLPEGGRRYQGTIALVGSLVSFVLAIFVYVSYDPVRGMATFQFEEVAQWIPSIGATYHIGVDGISLGLVLLTSFLTPLLIWYASSRRGNETPGSLLFTILALETCILGVLCSLDLLLFYVFWEAMLIPMYFLIALWGGENRAKASLKFIIYMMVGSLLMLAGILWFYWWQHTQFGGVGFTFDLLAWSHINGNPGARVPHDIQMWMFFFFFISFAIKVPLFPFHTWFPDAMAEGPVAFNVLMVEVGAYAFVRFCLVLFPDASLTWAPLIMGLAVINIIYGAILASVQTDLKRLFAYASMSHAGFIMLGIFSMTIQGVEGAVLYMINSGITTAALFLIADMLIRRRGSRMIRDFGGLAPVAPTLFFMFMVVMLGAVALPGLNGFTSEFLVLMGAIRSNVATPWFGYAAGAGVVLSVVYMLWMFQRVMYGETPDTLKDTSDLDGGERATLWPFLAVILLIGIGSALFTRPMHKAAGVILNTVTQGVSGTPQSTPDLSREHLPQ